jgi:hypothetical protein
VAEFIPLIMNTISLQPPQHLRQSPAFNKEVFVDFMGAQIKTLSFLAYIIRWVPVIQCSGSVNIALFWLRIQIWEATIRIRILPGPLL